LTFSWAIGTFDAMASRRSSSRTPELARRVAREVGERLKAARRERRVAQDAFAKAMGFSRTTASNIERGQQRLFLDQIYRAAEILRISIDVLLPAQQPSGREMVVHAASDDPLPAGAARQVAEVARELEAGQSTKRRTSRKA
jgi:transcriptional regulator with XRE-family HTH domain